VRSLCTLSLFVFISSRNKVSCWAHEFLLLYSPDRFPRFEAVAVQQQAKGLRQRDPRDSQGAEGRRQRQLYLRRQGQAGSNGAEDHISHGSW
jgi:hypothetical protein